MDPLSAKARAHLKGLGHHLQPVTLVGKEGLSAALVDAVKVALGTHELIKVKLGENVVGDRHELSEALAASSESHLVGLTGRTVLLFRRHPKKPKILLPGETAPKPKAAPGKAKRSRTPRTAKATERSGAAGSIGRIGKAPQASQADRSARARTRASRDLDETGDD